jgi:hypothetical protein
MEEIFVNTFIPSSILLETYSMNGIHLYEDDARLYVLANVNTVGQINKELKEEIVASVKQLCKPIKFVSMYEQQADFVEDVDSIIWGTYVWFANAPEHYIHYDENASPSSLQPR